MLHRFYWCPEIIFELSSLNVMRIDVQQDSDRRREPEHVHQHLPWAVREGQDALRLHDRRGHPSPGGEGETDRAPHNIRGDTVDVGGVVR